MLPYTNSIINIIIGFFVGVMIAKVLIPTAVYHGPNSNEIIKKIYYDSKTNSCYRFEPKIYMCPIIFKPTIK